MTAAAFIVYLQRLASRPRRATSEEPLRAVYKRTALVVKLLASPFLPLIHTPPSLLLQLPLAPLYNLRSCTPTLTSYSPVAITIDYPLTFSQISFIMSSNAAAVFVRADASGFGRNAVAASESPYVQLYAEVLHGLDSPFAEFLKKLHGVSGSVKIGHALGVGSYSITAEIGE